MSAERSHTITHKRKAFTPLERNISNRGSKRFLTGPVRKPPSNGAAFTLIELLVVIAIVALLMSILMPSLTKVREQAKASVCKMNLHHWALVWSMYTDNNDGYFANRNAWPNDLRPYYKDGDLRLCPKAVKPYIQGARQPFATWGPISKGEGYGWAVWPEPDTSPDNYLSYACNEWVIDIKLPGWADEFSAYFWKTPNVRGAASVPLFLDCSFFAVNPFYESEPPEYEGDVVCSGGAGAGGEMKRCCVNRHNGTINSLFLDYSVRTVGLKELWRLKWHRHWPSDVSGWPIWPHWMKNFKDYD